MEDRIEALRATRPSGKSPSSLNKKKLSIRTPPPSLKLAWPNVCLSPQTPSMMSPHDLVKSPHSYSSHTPTSTRSVRSRPSIDLVSGLQTVDPSEDIQRARLGLRKLSDRELGKTVLQRESPRARATLRCFLSEFLVDTVNGGVDIRRDIDLRNYSREASRPTNDATVQEICVMQPRMLSLDISGCSAVGDAALWALSRHCPELESLKASECQMTRIGLRALALGCAQLCDLDISSGPSIDDAALCAIAAGCPRLQKLKLKNCHSISDDGLAVLARGCRELRDLDVSNCARLGEFGDRALLAIGRYCPQLQRLNMFGCAHVQDAGVIAIARGCNGLRALRLSGCQKLTGAALSALAKKCPLVQELKLAGCKRLKSVDLCRLVAKAQKCKSPKNIYSGCRGLMRLDLSGCDDIDATGLRAIAKECPDLIELSLRKCASINDNACYVLAEYASRLETIDLSGCAQITEVGVRALAKNLSALGRLDLTDCAKVSRHFLLGLVENELEFTQLAADFIGLEPKPEVQNLKRAAALGRRRYAKATKIQALWRGSLIRAGMGSLRRRLLVDRGLVQFQARWRSFSIGRKGRARILRKKEMHSASLISALWRGTRVRASYRAEKRAILRAEKHAFYAKRMQRYYRGHMARCRVRKLRLKVAAQRRIEARIRARQELSATRLESLWRGRRARLIAQEIRIDQEAVRKLAVARSEAALCLQSHWRIYLAKLVAAERRALREAEIRGWRAVRLLQAYLRAKRAKALAEKRRQERELEIKAQAAIMVQAAWRANRARFLATMAAALCALREQEQVAILAIQAAARRFLAQIRATGISQARTRETQRNSAVLKIQRLLRGHFGRTDWTVAKRFALLREQAAPLYSRLDVLSDEARSATEKRDLCKSQLARFKKDTREIVIELKEVSRVGHATWDTARITGFPQRFNTKFVKQRLTEMLADHRARVAELTDQARLQAIIARDKERLMREVRRELAPLADGLAERTRKERIEGLRKTVRLKQHNVTRIQARVRTWCVERALVRLAAGGHAQWEYLLAEITGDFYYWNCLTGQTRWDKPPELEYPDISAEGLPLMLATRLGITPTFEPDGVYTRDAEIVAADDPSFYPAASDSFQQDDYCS